MLRKTLPVLFLWLLMFLCHGQVALIGWTFENASKRAAITNDATFQSEPYTADLGISENVDIRQIKTVGRPTFSGWVQGSGGSGTYAPNTNGWDNGAGSKCWQISLVTSNYGSLALSSKQYGSSTGPRDFHLQYSLDDAVWTDVPGAAVTAGSNWSSGVLNSVTLPAACANQPLLHLRWVMTSNTSISGTTVGSAGTNRIDDISVTGVSLIVPNLSVIPTTLSGFSYIAGHGPSEQQTFTVSGSDLISAITIAAPPAFEVSFSPGEGTDFLLLDPIYGSVATTLIFVRLKAALPAADYSEEICITATEAIDGAVACFGSVTQPQITLSSSSLSEFLYMEGLGPSAPQSFTVSGSSLTDVLTLSAPQDYEISATPDGSFEASLALTPSYNAVPASTIYLRLKAGLSTGAYNGQILIASSAGAASQNLVCSGSVIAGAAPPAAIATEATAIGPSYFTAHWNPAAHTTGYRLDVYTGWGSFASDLFISEYLEGSSYNKYIEVFNGTGEDADLSDYRLELYSNGAATPTVSTQLSGILPNGAVVVYKNSSATLVLPAGVTAVNNSAVNFNGDDAVALYRISSASFTDILGRIGEDPGTQWGVTPLWTINATLVRKNWVSSGVTQNPASGFPSLVTEWDCYPEDTVSFLGAHSFGDRQVAYVPGYEDLDVGNVTLYTVTGLAESTGYHYRLRAVNPYGTSENSNEIDVSTTSSTAPLITVDGSLNAFSTIEGSPSAPQSYQLTGVNLSEPIQIVIPAGFELSTDGGAIYQSIAASVPADFNGSILVRLTGLGAGSYSGNLVHSSPGAANVALWAMGSVTGESITVPTIQAYDILCYPAFTSISLEWTPGNGAQRVVKINTSNSFTVPADGSSPSPSTAYSGSGEQVIYNGTTEYIEGLPFNGCTVTNLEPNTSYWFRIYEYNGLGTETRYLGASAPNNPRSATTTNSAGSGYYASIYGYGTTLKGLLHSLLKNTHTTQYSYAALINQLPYTDEDPSNPENLVEIYTGWSVPKSSFGNETTDWNREHTWSKSHGDFGDVAPAGTDLHHLRPCDGTVNMRKSNKDFAAGGALYVDASPPAGYTGNTGCYDTDDSWEPRDADKGDVARMIMYMAVRYEGDDPNLSTDLELVDYVYSDGGTQQPYYGKLATLLQWHAQDPPDPREQQRNERIAERQGNRNPFIDRPGYAARIWAPCPIFNSNIGSSAFTGNWSVPLNATAYFLQVATDSLFTSFVLGYENKAVNQLTSWTVSGLTPGATYYYRLRSFFVSDYGMFSPYLSVTLVNPILATLTASPSQPLEEPYLQGMVLNLYLANASFADNLLLPGNFALSNAPAGLSVQSASYLTPGTASLLLSYSGADFDANYYSFTVTVAAVEINVAYSVTSNPLTILAHVENTASIALEGSLIRLTLTPVAEAAAYRIFASDDPYGEFVDLSAVGAFDLISPNIWRCSATLAERRFFRVAAILN